ncbi:MAG: hypothetical protein R3D43_04655 [Tepidamorphaceae bacterium]
MVEFSPAFSDAGNGNTHDIEDIAHYYVMYAELISGASDSGGFYDLDYQRLTEKSRKKRRGSLSSISARMGRCLLVVPQEQACGADCLDVSGTQENVYRQLGRVAPL